MQIKINDVNINYVRFGNKKGKDIILLHGWGQNIEMMMPLGRPYEKKYCINILDLPGFGESEEPKFPWTLNDYEIMLEEYCKANKIKNPIIMGHSFGGRLAILYASRNKVSKLVLFGSPVTIEKSSNSLKVRILKSIKKFPCMKKIALKAKKYIGSRDYKAASEIMRGVLVNTVNKDLSEDSKKIAAPTLIIWGDYDTEASIEDAKLLEKNIKDAGLIVLNGTHYAYLENLNRVITILNNFLGGK